MSTVAPSNSVVAVEIAEHVATCWLDRPHAKNAMGPEFFEALPRVMADVARDDSVRVVILAARGDTFCAGLDLKQIGPRLIASNDSSPARRARELLSFIRYLQDSIGAVARCAKPVIAAIQGSCLGGGMDLIAACDVRVASATATFSIKETPMAIVADLGSLQRLPGIIGRGRTAELALSGVEFSAEEAERMGLVTHVAKDPDSLMVVARDLAVQIASNPPLTVEGVKAVLAQSADSQVAHGLEFVATWNSGHLISEDLMEAFNAFVEKRRPRFEGA